MTQAELEAYGNRIKDNDWDGLYEECMKLKQENMELHAREKEYKKSEPALAKEYNRLKKENTVLREERDKYKKDLQKACEQNIILLNNRFSKHNEKADTIKGVFSEDVEDPLSEDAPEAENKSSNTDNEEKSGDDKAGTKVVPFREKDPLRKYIRSRLDYPGKSKKTAHDFSGLPHTDNYIMDTDLYDKLYGAGNWEISAWHSKEFLHHIPSEYYVEVKHAPVIKQINTGKLFAQPMPGVMMRYSSVTESALSHMMYQKFFMCATIYRQEADLENHGAALSRQTISNWIIKFTEERLVIAYDHAANTLRGYRYQQGDETTYLAIHDLEKGEISGTKDFVWAHMSSELDDSVNPIVIYCFELSRSTDHLRKFYDGCGRTDITCDAYISYPTLEKETDGLITVTGCYDHARRRLVDAFRISYHKGMSREAVDDMIEMQGIILVNRIYLEEYKLSELSAHERYLKRQGEVKKAVNDFFGFMHGIDLSDPTLSYKMKDAVTYSLNQEKYLRRFLEDGHIPMTNAACERAIKPVALLRRNSLFFNTKRGAEAGMVVHSLVETARRNGANPELYLQYVLEEALDYKNVTGSAKLDELMPWSKKYKAWEREKFADNKAFSLKSNTKPYYKPDKNGSLEDEFQAAG
jgi:hypothetical protein